uniref:Uncharacterized protein n=1 Tax=Meloidogyne enterolobii TaxID=390850 RepID=A0A6V7WGR2_MELEN|nr:unnamed protein product [Meloidogyne enterolobii]
MENPCIRDFPNALKRHVRKEHKQYGTNFWESIVEYKKDNKLESYGLIGIGEGGIPYMLVCSLDK